MRRAATFLAGFVCGVAAVFYGTQYAIYRHLTHTRRAR